MIFDRNARRCAVLGRRASNSSFSLSAGATLTSSFGRPVRMSLPNDPGPRIHDRTYFYNEFITQDTRAYAEKALAIDSELADAHTTRAAIAAAYDYNPALAFTEVDRGL